MHSALKRVIDNRQCRWRIRPGLLVMLLTASCADMHDLQPRNRQQSPGDLAAAEAEVLAQHQLQADLRARNHQRWVELMRALGGGFEGNRPLSGMEVTQLSSRKSS